MKDLWTCAKTMALHLSGTPISLYAAARHIDRHVQRYKPTLKIFSFWGKNVHLLSIVSSLQMVFMTGQMKGAALIWFVFRTEVIYVIKCTIMPKIQFDYLPWFFIHIKTSTIQLTTTYLSSLTCIIMISAVTKLRLLTRIIKKILM